MYKYELRNLFPIRNHDRKFHKGTCNSKELHEYCVKTWPVTFKGRYNMGRPRRRCETNTEMLLSEIVCDDCHHVAISRGYRDELS
jgi:hypothetical protein